MTKREQAQWVLALVLALRETGDVRRPHHPVGEVLIESEYRNRWPQALARAPDGLRCVGAISDARRDLLTALRKSMESPTT